MEQELDPRLVEVYKEVGTFLKRFKSGARPKVVKILPGLSNWEEVRARVMRRRCDCCCSRRPYRCADHVVTGRCCT